MKENKGIMTNTKIFVITHKEFNMINTPSKGELCNHYQWIPFGK